MILASLGELYEARIREYRRDRLGRFADEISREDVEFAHGRVKSMNAKQVSKLLLSRGYHEARQRGSHAVFKKQGHRNAIVPQHGSRPLPRGTLMNVLRVAEIY